MINKKSAPGEWAGLMYELEDAQEHLTALISEMNATDDFDEVDLRIQLGHVFSHLNRAWHRRDKLTASVKRSGRTQVGFHPTWTLYRIKLRPSASGPLPDVHLHNSFAMRFVAWLALIRRKWSESIKQKRRHDRS